jgi:ribosomal protein S18 acetylase RimI-like enzyme
MHTELEWRAMVEARNRFVVEVDGRVVGLAAGGDSSDPGAAALTSLWVAPEARGKGVGDRLIEVVDDWSKSAGYRRLVLWVAEGNERAERLYQRNGFARTGEAIREPRPEFEMSKPL